MIKKAFLLSSIFLLNSCIMPAPYGGFIFVSPMDLIRINQERSEADRKRNANRPPPTKWTEITLTSNDLLSSKDNIGFIEFTFSNEETHDISLFLDYRNKEGDKLISTIKFELNNKLNKFPLIDYPKMDKRYPDYQLIMAQITIKSHPHIKITFPKYDPKEEACNKNTPTEIINKKDNSSVSVKVDITKPEYQEKYCEISK